MSGFSVEPLAGGLLKVSQRSHRLDPAVITRLLAEKGLYVFELTTIQPDLESVFLNLTADDHLGARQQHRRKPEQRRTQVNQRGTGQQREAQSQRQRRAGRPSGSGRR